MCHRSWPDTCRNKSGAFGSTPSASEGPAMACWAHTQAAWLAGVFAQEAAGRCTVREDSGKNKHKSWAVRRKCRCSYYHNHYLCHPPSHKEPCYKPPSAHLSHGTRKPRNTGPGTTHGCAGDVTHTQGCAGVAHAQGRAGGAPDVQGWGLGEAAGP